MKMDERFLHPIHCFRPETPDRKQSDLESKFMKQCIHIFLYKLIQNLKNNLQATVNGIIIAKLAAKFLYKLNMIMLKMTHHQ